jgi:ParB family transcriptional regulator, chromosome partitioning protein
MTRKALGRGLGALLSAEPPVLGQSSLEIDIDSIEPSPMQPRTHFDDGKLQELAHSIKSNGVIQPLLVRGKGDRFELVAGERRLRAAQLAGMTRVPVVVKDVPDEKMLELALIENIQREDLNAIEEARAYQKLIETIGLTQESLAEQVGRDRSYITNYLRLLRLPEELQKLLEDGKLTTGHGRTLLGVSDVESQRRIAKKVIDRGLSVRETERIVQELATAQGSPKKRSRAITSDPNVKAVETKLRRQLGTQVRIVQHPTGTGGRIELEFYSLSDLNRLLALLTPAARAAP